MSDPVRLPPAQHATIGDLRMAYYEAGPKGRGIPTIFCHGFPELAYSWRHQLQAFGAADRWAIAPDQRGYGSTPGPDAVEAYDMEHLTGDLIGLLDHLGAEKAIWCGHDWGGALVWQMALRHPDPHRRGDRSQHALYPPGAGRSYFGSAHKIWRGHVHGPLPTASER